MKTDQKRSELYWKRIVRLFGFVDSRLKASALGIPIGLSSSVKAHYLQSGNARRITFMEQDAVTGMEECMPY